MIFNFLQRPYFQFKFLHVWWSYDEHEKKKHYMCAYRCDNWKCIEVKPTNSNRLQNIPKTAIIENGKIVFLHLSAICLFSSDCWTYQMQYEKDLVAKEKKIDCWFVVVDVVRSTKHLKSELIFVLRSIAKERRRRNSRTDSKTNEMKRDRKLIRQPRIVVVVVVDERAHKAQRYKAIKQN